MAEIEKTASFSDVQSQKQRPFITVGEARKILGNSYNKITDDELRRVIISMGDLARLLVANPQLFKINDEGKFYE